MIARNIHSGSNHKAAAKWNRQLVLRLIGRHGQLSRRRIADMVGLRGSTLTYIVREFLEQDILTVAGKANSHSVGQKQVLLEMNADLGWTLGISLRTHQIRMVIYDAQGRRLYGRLQESIKDLASAPGMIAQTLVDWQREIPALPGRLLGIGVGVPGVVDGDQGIVLNSRLFEARQVPLRDMLKSQFGEAAVVVDSGARLGALAEATQGAGKFLRNFIYFIINERWEGDLAHFHSFGTALYLDERMYHGSHFAAGELDGALAPSGDFILSRQDATAWGELEAPMTPALEAFATVLAGPMASLVNLLDVPKIILGGTARICNQAFMQSLNGLVNQMLIAGPRRRVDIVASSLEGEAVARGAAMAAADAAMAELCDR